MERKVARIVRKGIRAITANFKARIDAMEIGSGGYLPTERELQAQFTASRTTIRRALASLVDTRCRIRPTGFRHQCFHTVPFRVFIAHLR